MWRVMADIEMDDAEHRFRRSYRDRFQIEDLRDGEFFERYRFTKGIFEELLDILRPALERQTRR